MKSTSAWLLLMAGAAAACGHDATAPTTTAPTITSVGPSSVLVGFPQALVVTGSNFAQGLAATIAATTAPTVFGPPTVRSISNITATSFEMSVIIPAAGGYTVFVTSGGQASAPFPFTLQYACPPTVYFLSGPAVVLVGESVYWTVAWETCPAPMFESGYPAALQSLNPSVATVDSQRGKVIGVSPGVANIRWGSSSPTYGTQSVTVLDAPPATFTLSIADRSFGGLAMKVGETRQLDALANFSGGSTTVTRHSQWTSADPSVATVADGLVTGQASGSVQINAKYGEAGATYTVKVQ